VSRPAVHADCVLAGTCGVLIRGGAGSGKTSLADALIEAARQRGHLGLLVADDYAHLTNEDGRLLARVPDTIRGRMEVRGVGLMEARHLAKARVGLVVDLVPAEQLDRLPDAPLLETCLEGVQLPLLRCPENDLLTSLRLVRWGFRHLMPDGPDYI